MISRTPAFGNSYRFLYHGKMKTTLDINDELLVRAKALSARERTSLTSLIEAGLQLRMRRAATRSRAKVGALAIYRGKGGLMKGIDPLSNRSMIDAADDGT